MRILLAEDNLNNQQIACELLAAEGALVDVANNGKEAIELMAKTPSFDVVLMDLQMPVLDGLTATKHIRKELLSSVPIVAMTANAMISDRDACIAAGMNEHVGKPFDLNHLIHVLRQQVGWESLDAKVAVPTSPSAELDVIATAAGVDLAAALARLGGKRDLYLRMLPMFLTNVAAIPNKLSAALTEQQFLQASQQLHSLKGLASTMGATALANHAALAEKQLAGKISLKEATWQVNSINTVISETLPHLNTLLVAMQPNTAQHSEVRSNPHESVDQQALTQALTTLMGQLKNADMAAMTTMDKLAHDFESVFPELLPPLRIAINNLDFTIALRLCLALLDSLSNKGTSP